MLRQRRKKIDIDYSIFHRTGDKVPKFRQNMTSNLGELVVEEINVSSDIEDLFETYQIKDICDLDSLQVYMSKIQDIKQKFRRVHSHLKLALGDKYDGKYPEFENDVEKLLEKLKEGNKKVNDFKVPNNDPGFDKNVSDKNTLEKEFERQFIIDQIYWDIDNCKWDLSAIDEIRVMIATMESRLQQFYKTCSVLQGLYSSDSEKCKSSENEKIISLVRENINLGHESIKELKSKREALEMERRQFEEMEKLQTHGKEEANKIQVILACADNLLVEIQTRHDFFIKKCEVNLDSLSDYDLLNLQKRDENLQSEVRELIDKVSEFEKFVLPCGEYAQDVKETATKLRENCIKTLKSFSEHLDLLIINRDVSEKKVENAAALQVNLAKFKGYNSEVDIFTFRSDFKKFIEPILQKTIWADYLKKNLLGGPAYNLVSRIVSIDDIWTKLFDVYGNTQLLLQNKLGALSKSTNFEKIKDDEKIVNAITTLLNSMSELSKLAKDYDLENELYYGGGLQKVFTLIGSTRERRFIRKISKEKLKNDQKWLRLVNFLEQELSEKEAYVLNEKSKCLLLSECPTRPISDKDDKSKSSKNDQGFLGQIGKVKCEICNLDDHTVSCDKSGNPIIDYIACKTFVDLDPRGRDKLLYKKRFCSRCLTPGIKWNLDHECNTAYRCNQKYEKGGKEFFCKKHVLTCGFHCSQKSNQDLFEKFRKEIILPNTKLNDFTKNMKLSFFAETYVLEHEEQSSIYAFQKININGLKLNIFYDNGCGDLCVTKETVDKLASLGRAKQEQPGPIVLNGVANQKSVCEHGAYSILLPLLSGKDAKMCGLCVDSITIPFPKYPLERVETDFKEKVTAVDPNIVPNLPKLPKYVGGKVDIMIGKQYLKYFPKEVTRLDTGLTIYNSCFKSLDGTTGVISGPHPEFTKVDRSAHFSNNRFNFLSIAVKQYNDFMGLVMDVPLLGCKESLDENPDFTESFSENGSVNNSGEPSKDTCMESSPNCNSRSCDYCSFLGNGESLILGNTKAPKSLKYFERVEEFGTVHSYRCPKCRNCYDCKNGCQIEDISIKEEIEQDLINKSVTVDTEQNICTARLPFIADPDLRLKTNFEIALKVYRQQVKRLAKSPQDKIDVIEAEKKLQTLGFVDYLENLDFEDQKRILLALVQYYIPWRLVWSDSITTPLRPVFDGTFAPVGECCLNEILAKGTNNMNSLIQMLIRWTVKLWGFHSDIRKMYNAVHLDKEHWRYQLYLWHPDLDVNAEPKIKVIKTCIYGIKSSGNQAERAVRLTAQKNAEMFPIAYNTILHDLMVDDCISGQNTKEDLLIATDELKLSLEKGGFTLKGLTFTGEDPDVTLSGGKDFITVGGLKWYPKDDYLMLNLGELNFAKKVRGRKLGNRFDIPEKLTMTQCVGKVAELFDPLGRFAPIIASMKLDISELHCRGLKWENEIPNELKETWISNFGTLDELRNISFRRAIVPVDAKNLDIVTLDTADASSKLICAAVYARFERKDGSFSCQLIFSRSKVLPKDISTPRAELMAATMNATTGYTVKKSLGSLHKRCLKLSDSMVALYWVANERSSLKTWVRNRIIEINRLCDLDDWRHVKSEDMIADLGTRQTAKISDMMEDGVWVNGYPWMSLPECEFPTKSLKDIRLSGKESDEATKEMVHPLSLSFFSVKSNSKLNEKIKARYDFSNYLIDPNKYRFRKVVRIMSLVLKFVYKISRNVEKIWQSKLFNHKCPYDLPKLYENKNDRFLVTSNHVNSLTLKCDGGKVIEISNFFLKSALFYFSLKASSEVKQFLKRKKFSDISTEIDGVLYYSSRFIPSDNFEGYPELCKSALDLCETTFCVPIMDPYSPVAISIAMEIHWHHPDVGHKGLESILRQTLCIAFIIEGRTLGKFIKHGCIRCRLLNKVPPNALMGPIQKYNLCIAPAFFAAQIDIFGPFKSFSNVNKRATIKVWFLIFCCCTTGAVDIRVMEDYSTDSFLLSFVRFSCRFGYPLYLLPDAGSQLLKGCENMSYSYTDCKQRLSMEYGVQYLPCPVGAHYVHGKVERKIREVKKCVTIQIQNERLSTLQWETLMQHISNSINNLPIGLKNRTQDLENLDILTPNRLILGRNNDRCPNSPLIVTNNCSKILETNEKIFKAWFKAWLVSFVPSLIERPKWHKEEENLRIGDVVLFLKSEKEYEKEYQYGMISSVKESRDKRVREVEVEYQNHSENVKRKTVRGVRDLVLIHPVDELSIYEQLATIVS